MKNSSHVSKEFVISKQSIIDIEVGSLTSKIIPLKADLKFTVSPRGGSNGDAIVDISSYIFNKFAVSTVRG